MWREVDSRVLFPEEGKNSLSSFTCTLIFWIFFSLFEGGHFHKSIKLYLFIFQTKPLPGLLRVFLIMCKAAVSKGEEEADVEIEGGVFIAVFP